MKPEFDRVAQRYAAFRVGYSPETAATIAREAKGGDVLDVATGTGLLAHQLRPLVRRVVGVDVALDMLRAARVPVAQGAAERLPFRDGAFDAVTCAQAFHWVDRPRALAEFRRVTRRGGVVAVVWKYPDASAPYDAMAIRLLGEMTGKPVPAARLDPPVELAGARRLEFTWDVPWTVDGYVGFLESRESLRQRAGEKREAWIAEVRRQLALLTGGRPFAERNVDALFLIPA